MGTRGRKVERKTLVLDHSRTILNSRLHLRRIILFSCLSLLGCIKYVTEQREFGLEESIPYEKIIHIDTTCFDNSLKTGCVKRATFKIKSEK